MKVKKKKKKIPGSHKDSIGVHLLISAGYSTGYSNNNINPNLKQWEVLVGLLIVWDLGWY